MQDADDFRRDDGTAADFSGWHINTNGMKPLSHLSSSERIIEPEDADSYAPEKDSFETDDLPELADDDGTSEMDRVRMNSMQRREIPQQPPKPNPTKPLPRANEIPRQPPRPQNIQPRPSQSQQRVEPAAPPQKREVPGTLESRLDPNELKMLAKHLLPSVDKINPEDYSKYSAMAIDFAFNFLNVWKEKIKLGE